MKVYLDQNVVSNLAKANGGWKTTALGSVLDAGIKTGKVEVWPSPAHVLETFLCADTDPGTAAVVDTPKLDLRVKIAATLLDLSGARRMAPGVDVLVLQELVQTLNLVAPDCIADEQLVASAKRDSQRTYLGLLALLAAVRGYDRPEAMGDMLRNKLRTTLIHGRYALDPDGFVDRMIKAADTWDVTTADIWEGVDKLTLPQIRLEIDSTLAGRKKLTQQALTRLQKRKKDVAAAYGAVDIGENVGALLHTDPWLLLTFDYDALAKQWGKITKALGTPVAVPASAAAIRDGAAPTPASCVEMLQRLVRAFSATGLLVTSAMNQVILGELEMCLAQGDIPAGGPGFDADHAAALTWADVFITNDTDLQNLARRIAKQVSERTNGKQTLHVVANEKQFSKLVAL